jgi:hypothetical protein
MPARGVFRGLYSVLFDDPDFRRLPTSARFLLVTLRLCRDAGPSAIFEYSADLLMRQTGLSPRALETSFHALEAGSWIVREYPIVWVRNALRYDPMLRLADPKHKHAVLRWLNALPRLKIVLTFCDYYELPRPFGDPSETLPRVITTETEKEKEKELLLRSDPKTDPSAARIQFDIPNSISAALAKAPTFSALPRLHDPAFWQSQLRAYGRSGIDFPSEILKAEAWLATHPARRPHHATGLVRFLGSWFSRAGDHP